MVDVVTLLQKLIQIQTVNPPGNEKDLALFIADLLHEDGVGITVQDLGNNRANLIADIGNDNGPLLIFNGHLDVVPATGEWIHPPFSAFTDGSFIYGRGSADMKAGLAAMIIAFMSFFHKELKGRLRLLFVADEESFNLGTTSYMKNIPQTGNTSKYALIGEPTELNVCRGHLGVERYWIHCKGKSAHSSKPEEGVNAIGIASILYASLDAYHKMLRQKKGFFGSPSCTVTMITGGEKMNLVPSSCKLMVDRRTIPGETPEGVLKELQGIIDNAFPGQQHLVSVEPFFSLLPAEIPEDSLFLQTASRLAKKVNPLEKVMGFEAGCEQGLLLSGGIEALVYGPGSIKMGHVENECVPIDQLKSAVRFYEQLASEILL